MKDKYSRSQVIRTLYHPEWGVLGRAMRQEHFNKARLVNEYIWIPVTTYLESYILPSLATRPHFHYLDVACGTGLLSARITSTLRATGHDVTLITTDLVNNVVGDHSHHIQSNAQHLPLKAHSIDFVTMNLAFRYLTGATIALPDQQILDPQLEQVAQHSHLTDEARFVTELQSKARFLQAILHRILKPGGHLLLTITTEQADQSINIGRSLLALFKEAFYAENNLYRALMRFLCITNQTSSAFLKGLITPDIKTLYHDNHFFNNPQVIQALLVLFNGQVIYDNPHTRLSLLHFTAPPRPSTAAMQAVSVQEVSIDRV